MELRGFDSYPVTLGDEMRGERASLGKTLGDAERELRIKARVIAAIENCDLEGFPNRSVIPGYIRSYARYLCMDEDDCHTRFCQESGYQSQTSLMMGGKSGRRGADGPAAGDRTSAALLAGSRFANPPSRTRFQTRVSLGAVTSSAALLALMAGLSYGGYALLQDIQRVGFAPMTEAPVVVSDAPVIAEPEIQLASVPTPDPRDYQLGGALAAMTAPAALQPVEALRRDGPISAIDPHTAGIFAAADLHKLVAGSAANADPMSALIEPALAEASRAAAEASGAGPLAAAAAEPAVIEGAEGQVAIALHASEEAWVRISDGGTVVFEGIMGAGDTFELPPRMEAPVVKSGNAGGVFIVVDGVAYGPLGKRGQIARNISLVAEDVRTSMPQAASVDIASAGSETHRRAEAAAAQQ